MKVVSSGAARLAAAQDQPLGPAGQQRYRRFKAGLQERLKNHGVEMEGWKDFRRVAVALFGPRPALDRSQLTWLAKHPEKVLQRLQSMQSRGRWPADSTRWSPQKAAKVYAGAAQAALDARPGEVLRVATVNDDFTDRKTNLPRIKAGVMLVQEAKNTRVRKVLPKKTHGVHQNTGSVDKAGSAVVWKKKGISATDRGYAMGVRPNGAGMLTRWISWTDMKVGDTKVRMASVHRPPQRFSHLWPRFDANLAAFVKSTRHPIVIGMDANQRDPQRLARVTGLRWHAPPGSIDGFLVSPGVKIEKIRRLPKGTSDHHPVVAQIRLPPPKK